MNPMELFAKEFPHLSARFDELVDAIQMVVRNPRGVRFHSLPAAVEGFDAAG